jgi:hypothetical protein
MTKTIGAATSLALAMTLQACGSPPANDTMPNQAEPAANDVPVEATPTQVAEEPVPAPAPSPAPLPTAVPSPTPSPQATEAPAPGPGGRIPVAVRGRWGLTPGDCTSARGDAKGLLVITPDTLRFYESRGTLSRIIERDRSRIVADFDFAGEGETWQRRMVLDAQDGGRTLVRRERGPEAMAGALRYRRCL